MDGLNGDTGQSHALAVRPIEVGDAAAVVDLIAQLGYERTAGQVRAWVEGQPALAAAQAAFVACIGDELVGWIEVGIERRLQSASFALIGGLVVKDGQRGRGIGKRLCAEAERWSRDRGVGWMRVTSRSTREQAHRFYLAEGYRQVKTSVVFEKNLGA